MATYQFWRHLRSGETYAVRIEAGRVTGSCGPLHESEVSEDVLTLMHYDDSPADAEQIDRDRDDYTLVELEQRTARLNIRLTPRERDRLDGLAQQTGVPTSTYVRRRILTE